MIEIHTLMLNRPNLNRCKPIEYLIDPISGCWKVCSHTFDKDGYPLVSINNRQCRLHRLVYAMYRGSIPKGMLVIHKCSLHEADKDSKNCVNPNHLSLGTCKENSQDALRLGGASSLFKLGESPGTKLTVDRVREIYRLAHDGILSQSEIGDQFNISFQQVSKIKLGLRWSYVTDAGEHD